MTLTLNAGSSSLKYAVFSSEGTEQLAGLEERIAPGEHDRALQRVVDVLRAEGVFAKIDVVAHRVVHGGQRFSAPVRIDREVREAIRAISPLAPLHNPVNLLGIEVAQRLFQDATHVAIFDTAFHATLPAEAYRYAVPAPWYTHYAVRKYGFHGTSHRYVSAVARDVLREAGRPRAKIVTLHLGNGCSAAAVLDGACIDTTMGLTPLAGLMMGTRSGDVDPGLPAYLEREGMSVAEQDRQLNKLSGLLGVGGHNDMRTLLAMRAGGDEKADLAVAMFVYRLRKAVGAYAAALDGLDAIVFTAGIGENAVDIRTEVCAGLTSFGVSLDAAANAARSDHARIISTGPCAVLVVPTNEELAMATAARRLLTP